jgi:hypothetical protein
MNVKDLNDLRADFEELQKRDSSQGCDDNSCVGEQERYEDYPDYMVAMYKEIMPPKRSGIYFSRWDLKAMAAEMDEHFALDVRERMFKNFMQWVATPDDMKLVMQQFKNNIDMKCDLYKQYSDKYPSSKEIFDKKIQKAQAAKKYLDKVFVEFFT